MRLVEQPFVSGPGKAVLVAALMLLVLVIPTSQRPDPPFATKASEWRTLTLEDGSTVTLGPRTVITYAFNHNQRFIRLLSGEALFNVRKDRRRTFLVQTPVGCARALGTIFSVTHQLRSTAVTTFEGAVAVTRLDPARSGCEMDTVRLLAGQKAIVDTWAPVVARTIDTEVELAWTKRQIIFTGQTVEQALGEFNRRNWVQLDMPHDPEVLDMHIWGPFSLDDPARFAAYLEKELRWRRQRRR